MRRGFVRRIQFSNIFILLLVFMFSCKKEKTEALEVRPINNNTLLKNHTNGTDYLLNGLVVNAELVIEADVKIEVAPNAKITIGPKGKLIVKGTANKPVIITTTKNDRWAGIEFMNSTGDLQGVVIENAGSEGLDHGAITTFGESDVTLSDVIIREIGKGSALVANAKSNITVNSGCKIARAHVPYQKELSSTIQILKEVSYEHIGLKCILIKSYHGNSIQLEKDWLIKRKNLPYLFKETVNITKYELQVESGTEILMEIGAYMLVNQGGKLIMNGNINSPIILRCEDPSRTWNGISVVNGEAIIYGVHIKNVLSKDSMQGIISIGNKGVADIRYSNLVQNKAPCAITISKNGVLNMGYFGTNYFGIMHRLCDY